MSAGCAHCYAETLSGRNQKVLGKWGRDGTRVVAAETQWRMVNKWNADAAAALEEYTRGGWEDRAAGFEGKAAPPPDRPRVFCASLADVFEGADTMPPAAGPNVFKARNRLLELIEQTPALDWLLLTKRPENVLDMTGQRWKAGGLGIPANVWIGTTVEDKAALGRIDTLRTIPAAVRFLSCEPLLEDLGKLNLDGIHWVIVGGESGGGARPFALEWARSIVKQCKAAKVPVFMKQFGAHPVYTETQNTASSTRGQVLGLKLLNRKGGDLEEWPADMRVREFPTPTVKA